MYVTSCVSHLICSYLMGWSVNGPFFPSFSSLTVSLATTYYIILYYMLPWCN